MSSASRRVHVCIHGRVQGVSFRWYARQQAQSLGLAGWIRNRSDGAVEAIVEGDADAVTRFVEWTHRGPTSASVDRVDVEAEEPRGRSEGFRILD